MIRLVPLMRASLFITCYNDTLFPETGRAVVELLERLGVQLELETGANMLRPNACQFRIPCEAFFSQAQRFVQLYRDADVVSSLLPPASQ